MIRKATQRDFDFIYDLHVHPQVNRFLFYEIMSAEEFKAIFNELLEQDILYVYEEDGISMGMFKLSPQTASLLPHCLSWRYCYSSLVFRQGYAQRMLHQIILLGKERGILRLELGCFSYKYKSCSYL